MKDFYLGLDVGGTKCAVILGRCGDTMEIIDRIAFPTEAKKGFDHTIENIYAAIEEMMVRHSLSAENVQALGISCGGPLNSKTGRVLSPPNLFGWDDIPIVELMETRYGIPTALQNDANACALAEWRWGAGKGSSIMLFLTFGTGLGAGIVIGGKVLQGACGNAGELGHWRLADFGPSGYGKVGAFEGFCSGGGIAQVAHSVGASYAQRGQAPAWYNGEVSAKTVALAAAAGDEAAVEVFDESARRLGQGLALVMDLLNPDCIVIGSVYTRAEALFQKEMHRVLKKEVLPASYEACRVVPARLGDSIGDYAALSLAVQAAEK